MTVQNWVFSFGFGQKHPVSGEKLNNRFVEIPATSSEDARVQMCKRFGLVWAFQYESRQAAGVERHELRPLEGDAALGLMAGTTVAERACTLCVCLTLGGDAPDCQCKCHHVPDVGGHVITTAGVRTIEACADCGNPGIVCASPDGMTVTDSAQILDIARNTNLCMVSIAREIADAGCLILCASAHSAANPTETTWHVCEPCETKRDAARGGKNT